MFLPDIVGEERAAMVARFWSAVGVGRDGASCWEWQLCTTYRESGARSYGRFKVGGDQIYAHRFMFQLIHGPIPDDVVVRHKCDNEPCVNPRHLLRGTLADNTRDKFERGRGPDRRGEKHPLAKLTEAEIREIKRLRSMGYTQDLVAKKFLISRSHIYRIMNGAAWGHIA